MDVAVGVDRDAFPGHPLRHPHAVRMRRDEPGQPVLASGADQSKCTSASAMPLSPATA